MTRLPQPFLYLYYICVSMFFSIPSGMLGSNFHRDLYQFQQHFGGTNNNKKNVSKTQPKGRVTRAVEEAFELQNSSIWKNLLAGQRGMHPHHHKYRATTHTNNTTQTKHKTTMVHYYTARTVRRVLQYMSIDYVLLGLPIPQWAEDLLQQEQEQQERDLQSLSFSLS